MKISQLLYRRRRLLRNVFYFCAVLCFIIFASLRWMPFGGDDCSLLDFCSKFITLPSWTRNEDPILLTEIAALGFLLLLSLIHLIPAIIISWIITALISLFYTGDNKEVP